MGAAVGEGRPVQNLEDPGGAELGEWLWGEVRLWPVRLELGGDAGV